MGFVVVGVCADAVITIIISLVQDCCEPASLVPCVQVYSKPVEVVSEIGN